MKRIGHVVEVDPPVDAVRVAQVGLTEGPCASSLAGRHVVNDEFRTEAREDLRHALIAVIAVRRGDVGDPDNSRRHLR